MYQSIAERINDPAVTIVAVSKGQTTEKIDQAWQQGARHFGENYLQEAETKITELRDRTITWHFIGAIQSNKTRKIARLFDWVQTADRSSVIDRLSRHRPAELNPLNLCIQVNIDHEPQKAGCSPEDCLVLARQALSLPQLRLRGMMIIPQSKAKQQQVATFERAEQLFRQMQQLDPAIDTLSMGMSDDYLLALEHGATMVRPGTAIFGRRATK